MKTINIIKSTGSRQGDLVLGGVFGTNLAKEDGTSIFKIAPELMGVSHLFGYLENGTAPVQPQSIDSIEVPDEIESAMKLQLLNDLGVRWASMYKNMAPGQTGVLSAMLAGEANSVRNSVRNHLLQQNARSYAVPLHVIIKTDPWEKLGKNNEALLSALKSESMSPNSVSWKINDEMDPVDRGTDLLGSIEEVPQSNENEEFTEADTEAGEDAGYENFEGMEILAGGFITVIATSPEEAKKLAAFQGTRSAMDRSGFRIDLSEIISVNALKVTETQIDTSDDSDDQDGYPSERG